MVISCVSLKEIIMKNTAVAQAKVSYYYHFFGCHVLRIGKDILHKS